MMRFLTATGARVLFVLPVLLFLSAVSVQADSVSIAPQQAPELQQAGGPWQGGAEARLRLISAVTATGAADAISAGLEVKLGEGWKIYWRSPGDAGLPPVLDFSDSPAVKNHRMDFPAPERFTLFGLETYGYGERVVFPLTLETAASGKALAAVARFSGLVCSDVCIPIEHDLTLYLPKGNAEPSAHAHVIARAAAQVPSPATGGGVSVSAVTVRDDRLIVELTDKQDKPLAINDGDVLIETGLKGYGFKQPRFINGVAHIDVTGKNAAGLIGNPITLTVLNDDYLLEQAAVVAPRAAVTLSMAAYVMIIAFAGGLILNIMPCVLPVLSLKLSAILGLGGEARKQIRRSFLLTATGIILSFLLLAAMLLALRASGAAIGWGMQFQNPLFLGVLIVMMLGFALILLDRIILPIPAFAQRWSQKLARQQGTIHDLSAGALATVLATPCSAPFVGTAVAFAFIAPPLEMMLVFAAMGIGLAFPWLTVASIPGIAARLPKPGAWLRRVKIILAAGLAATAIWLGVVLTAVLADQMPAASNNWDVWKPQQAESLAAQGQVVLVDVTADWCLTCKANKIFVLEHDETNKRLDAAGVIRLQADWTTPNPDILAYLSSFDRYGIPFNAVYGPAAPTGIVLPEILTRESVAAAIDAAASSRP